MDITIGSVGYRLSLELLRTLVRSNILSREQVRMVVDDAVRAVAPCSQEKARRLLNEGLVDLLAE